MNHRIFDVRYSKAYPSDEAPLWCTCGWEGQAGAFAAHRLDSGEERSRKNMPTGAAAKWREKAS